MRRLVRLAQTQGDAASWERAARAQERDGLWLEAAESLGHARSLGADTRAAEEALEELPWGALAPRPLPVFALGHSPALAWSQSGRTLYVTSGERTVVALEPATGTRSLVATLPGLVVALAAEPNNRGVLVADLVESPSERPSSRVRLFLEGEREPAWELALPRAVRSLALSTRHSAFVWTGFNDRLYVHRLDALGRPEPKEAFDPFRTFHTTEGDAIRAFLGGPTVRSEAEARSPLEDHTGPQIGERVDLRPEARGLVQTAFQAGSVPSLPTARAWLRLASTDRLARHTTGSFTTARVLAVSPSGRNVAIAAAKEPTLKVADLTTGLERTFMLGTVGALAWAPDGRSLAVSTHLGLFLVESPPDTRAALESEWRTMQAQRGAGKNAFFTRLDADPRPEVTDWLLKRLEPPYRDEPIVLDVLDLVHCLVRRRQPVDLERLVRIRAQLPARRGFPGLADYREEVDWLIEVVRALERGEGCRCNLPFPTPRHHGSLERVGPAPGGGALYACTVCGRRFRVEEEDSREGSGRFQVTAVEGEAAPDEATG